MIPAREDGLGENLRRGSSMDKGQEPGVSVACAPEGEGTCLRGAYDSPVPPTRYSALPFGFGQIAKLMQSQFTKTILAVSKEISIPSSLGTVDFHPPGTSPHHHSRSSCRRCSHFLSAGCYLLVKRRLHARDIPKSHEYRDNY